MAKITGLVVALVLLFSVAGFASERVLEGDDDVASTAASIEKISPRFDRVEVFQGSAAQAILSTWVEVPVHEPVLGR